MKNKRENKMEIKFKMDGKQKQQKDGKRYKNHNLNLFVWKKRAHTDTI